MDRIMEVLSFVTVYITPGHCMAALAFLLAIRTVSSRRHLAPKQRYVSFVAAGMWVAAALLFSGNLNLPIQVGGVLSSLSS